MREVDRDRTGPPAESKGQSAPLRREVRKDAETLAREVDPAETQNDRLPERAESGNAHAARRVRIRIEIKRGGLAEVTERHVGIAEAGRDEGVHACAQ